MGYPTLMSAKDFSRAEIRGDLDSFLEMRMENDSNGNPIYIGWAMVPNSDTSAPVWRIVRVDYDGNQSPIRYRLNPVLGNQYVGIWDDRASYFA